MEVELLNADATRRRLIRYIERAVAIIGSANFTRGGLGSNLEAAVALTGTVNDCTIADVLEFAKSSALNYGQQVTETYAAQKSG